MIKKVLFCTAAIVAIFSICNLREHRASSNSSQSPLGYTSAPADQGRTCRTCHGPGSTSEKTEAFSSNIPAGGYVPGTTYQISLTLSEPGRSKFGFEAVATDNSNIKRGTFSGSGSVQAQSGRITHTTAGTSAPGGNKTWTFNWKAPATGFGTITFYAAMNATNGNGNDDAGDNIYTAKMVVNQDPSNGAASVADYIKGLEKLKIFPNPATDVLNIEAEGSKIESINVYNLAGQLVLSTTSDRLDISHLQPGPYMVKVHANEVYVSRFVKQ